MHFIVTTSDPSLTALSYNKPPAAQEAYDDNDGGVILSPTAASSSPESPPGEAVASGKKVVRELQQKLSADSDLLSLKIISLDTLVCQNECSGHGTCHQVGSHNDNARDLKFIALCLSKATRTCICEPFWLENFVRRNLMDGKSNCEWSVIYVGILLAAMCCGAVCGVCYFSCKGRSTAR